MYFEEFEVGKQAITPARKVNADDLDQLIELTGLNLSLFKSDEAAQKIGHPQRLMPGPIIVSYAMGLVCAAGWLDQVVAVVGFDDLLFLKPVHPGHELKIEMTVKHTKLTKNPSRGLVVVAFRLLNQKDEVVLTADGKYLVQTKEANK